MNKTLLFSLFLYYQIAFCQSVGEKLLHGRIEVESGNVSGVNIVNLVNEKSTKSDGNGDFYILAKAEDLLVFSSLNLDYFRKIIELEDLKPEVLIIKMTSKVTELDEVIVNKHPEINAVTLGISPKGIIKLTPAERKLATASSARLNPMGLDPLLNMISGRTKMLKKELEVEKKERLLARLDAIFEHTYFINTLKIPEDYTKGFRYYCIEDKKFAEVLTTKNKTKIEFLIVPLAEKFNKLISSEK
jgi:hypothetical protein